MAKRYENAPGGWRPAATSTKGRKSTERSRYLRPFEYATRLLTVVRHTTRRTQRSASDRPASVRAYGYTYAGAAHVQDRVRQARRRTCRPTGEQAKNAVDAVLDTIASELAAVGDVAIAGFGKFSVAERAAREGCNPATGETIQIAASRGAKFSAAAGLE